MIPAAAAAHLHVLETELGDETVRIEIARSSTGSFDYAAVPQPRDGRFAQDDRDWE